MKRILGLILAGIMLLSTVAYAEEFILRDGVHFGDTVEEIRSKESLQIDEDESRETLKGFNLWTEKGNVAGLEDVRVVYITLTGSGLHEISWSIPNSKDVHEHDDAYNMLVEEFTAQYGQPLGNTDGNYHDVIGIAIQGAHEMIDLYNGALITDGVGEIMDYAEWYVEYDESSFVKIEIIRCCYGKGEDLTYELNVGFTHVVENSSNTEFYNEGFIPEKLVEAYNENVPLFLYLFLQDADSDLLMKTIDFTQVKYLTALGQQIIYANETGDISFVFTAGDKSSVSSEFSFIIQMDDDNPLMNMPAWGLSYAYPQLDTTCDAEDFLEWVMKDGDGQYTTDSIRVTITYKKDDSYIMSFSPLN